MGVEVELLAPQGRSRLDLARAIAVAGGGIVQRIFYPQSEPSKVPNAPVFENLTLGYEVVNSDGNWLAKCVDDLTLQADLNRQCLPKPGWYRIVSDDARLLRLIMHQTSAESNYVTVMTHLAHLFGTEPQPGPDGMIRVEDQTGASVAIALPLPGERERPCELITAPLESNHQQHLDQLLSLARDLQFTCPKEGATHLHFDGIPLCSAAAIRNLVNLLWTYGDCLKTWARTNPNCRRLGPWPDSLLEVVQADDFPSLSWPLAVEKLRAVELTKYCDFNLVNLLRGQPDKLTFEVRIAPSTLTSEPILRIAELFEAILKRAIAPFPVRPQTPLATHEPLPIQFYNELGLTPP